MESPLLPPDGSTLAPTTNQMAISSMVAGIAGFLSFSIVFEDIFICVVLVLLASICAIACGHIARRQIRKAEGLERGKGIALTGLILGYTLPVVATVLAILAAILAALAAIVKFFFVISLVREMFDGIGDFLKHFGQ